MKLKKGAKTAIFIILLLVIVVGIIMFAMKFMKPKEKVEAAKVVNEINEYGYQLKENKSKRYKELFGKLKDVLEKDPIDEEEYAKLVSQMFILDLYTLSDKIAKTDVGGTDFVHSEVREDFLEKAMDTIYKYVESNLYGDRNQKLPTVKNVKVDHVETTSFSYQDETDKEAYKIKLSWDYQEDMEYETEATLVLVHEGKNLSVVEMD